MPPVRYAITAIAATIVVVLPIILTRIRARARKIRQVAEARFSDNKIVMDYLALYKKMIRNDF